MVLTTRKTDAQVLAFPPSPATTPWVEELPRAGHASARRWSLNPRTSIDANTAGRRMRSSGRTSATPNVEAAGGGSTEYELTAKENRQWVFNPAYPAQPSGATRATRRTRRLARPDDPRPLRQADHLRIHNKLPSTPGGFGSPEISTHLHNLHTPSESDGFSGDYYSATVRARP